MCSCGHWIGFGEGKKGEVTKIKVKKTMYSLEELGLGNWADGFSPLLLISCVYLAIYYSLIP